VLLLVSGLIYSKVPSGSWVLTAPVIGALRRRADHVTLGMLVAILGLILLTWAWWGLVRRVSGGHPHGVRLARWAAAAWSLPLLIAPPLFSGDGWSYVATGYLAGHGLSPYEVPPAVLPAPLASGVARVWLNTTSPYGPVPLAWGGMFSHATADPWLLLYGNRLLAVVGLVLLAAVAPLLARRAGVDPARATALAIASPFVIAHGVGGLHNDLLLAGLVAAALSVTTRERWWWGAVIAGSAAAVKVPGGGIAVGVVLLSLVPAASIARRLERAAQVAVVSVGTLLALSLVSGLGLGWISGLTATAGEPARLAPFALIGKGVSVLLGKAGPVGHALSHRLAPVSTAKDLGLVLLVVLLGLVVVRRRIPDEAAALSGAALVMTAVTLLSPALHYWYFGWCLPLLACARLSRRGGRSLLALLAALGLLAFADPALHIAWLSEGSLAVLYLGPLVAWATGGRRREGVTPRTLVRP
jgi:hypothetical protein